MRMQSEIAAVQGISPLVLSPFAYLMNKRLLGLWVLGLLVLSSAISVVYAKHLHRGLHIQLQQLQQERDKYHVEWTQLLLEQGTLGSDLRVEKVAREQLGMIIPPPNQIVVIKP